MNQPSFTSLIVTYNSAKDVSNLLTDLHVHAPASPVIVIDNASRDGTVAQIRKHFPHVQLIQNKLNTGYARAVNQGFDLCNTEYVLLLNPDIRISSPTLFHEMEAWLQHSREIAAAAPLQFKDDEKRHSLNFTWSYWTINTLKIYLSFLLQRNPVFTKPIRVTFLNAGCLFIRRSAFKQVGKLNEKYFMYGEEPDLFLKFRRYGFGCYLLPGISVIHYRERSLLTVPLSQRLKIRFHAVANITDALITGWAALLLGKIVVNQSRSAEEKG